MIAWVQATKLAVDASRRQRQPRRVRDRPRDRQAGGERRRSSSGRTASTARPTPRASRRSRSARRLAEGRDTTWSRKRGDDIGVRHRRRTAGGASTAAGPSASSRPRSSWYVIDDRQMYKPGEEVTLKGWLRRPSIRARTAMSPGSAVRYSASTYQVNDSRGNQIAQGSATVDAGRWLRYQVHAAEDAEPRRRDVQFETPGRRRDVYAHSFQVQEFRRPEFEVSAQASQGPFLVGGGGDVTVDAKYFAGGPLPGARRDVVRDRAQTRLHAAEPRRLRVRRLATVVGLSPT